MPTTTPLHLDILPADQRLLWDELAQLPPDFVLYGGTAIALQLGHRQSIDFDFFSNHAFDSNALDLAIPFLKGATITQREPNTLSCTVWRGGPVKLSFFGVPRLPRLQAPNIAEGNNVRIASLLDLAGTKASMVQMRAEAKDYLDIDALLTDGRVNLSMALASAAALYGAHFNPQITLKALTYFDDENVRSLSDEVKLRLVQAVKAADLNDLPTLPEPFYRHTP
jgi:Nucleotidyl transferase AbiEii toxin, Type IV TA system